jgi:putative endopeptidase
MKKILLILFVLIISGSVFSQDTYFLEGNLDRSFNPADDFFMFANGTFIKNNPIPASESTYGIFNLVEDSVYEYLRQICVNASTDKSALKGSNTQKIGDFFFSGLDENSIEKNGITPLNKWLEKINKVNSTDELMKVIAEMQTCGISPLFSFFIGQDLMQSSVNKVYLYQGGIGLPERDYYFNDDTRTKNIREKYIQHIAKMMTLLGSDGKSVSKDLMKLETELANASRKLEDLRDDYANYNKMTLKDFAKTTPSIKWNNILKIYGIGKLDTVVIGQPEFFTAVEKLLNDYDIDVWKEYLKWNLINETANLINKKFELEHFDFYGKVLTGATEQRPRFKRVLDNTNGLLGEILGMEYVKLYFPPEDKIRTQNLVSNMVDAFAERIKKLDWMSDATKEKALKKLGTMVKKIGYPDVWKDYSSLDISRDSYVNNVLNANNWHFRDEISKLNKPVDRTEWHMNPQTYNAYYNPSNNEIVIPAAILTIPGKKMNEVDDAFLYGFIGASTIGHEMTHGFDDQGRLYDSEGNLNGWWTAEDSSKFVVKSQLMIDQFNNFLVLDSMHVNGKATLGENIADLGGLVIGYDAMKKSKDGQENKMIGGFNADQRYFLGYAYSWAVYSRPETMARRIMTDVHSPPFLRVNGPMANINEFYKAFGMTSSNKMYRDDKIRVQIW